MPGTNGTRETPADASRADLKRDREGIFQFWLGVSGIVLLTAIAIFVSNKCTSNDTLKELFGGFLPFGGSFLTAVFLVIVWGFTAWALRRHLGKMLRDTVFLLNEATQQLAGKPDDASKGLVPRMREAMGTLERGLTTFEGIAETESLAKRHLIAYSKNPQEALTKLVDELVKDPHDIKQLCIVATMRGVFGKGTYDLGRYIIDYLRRRIEDKKDTFKNIRIIAPNNKKPPTDTPNLRLYPLCARYFALKVLLDVRGAYVSLLPLEKGTRLPLVISLSFSGNDIFPAWHLWCKRRLVILPALGYEDYDKLSEALPIAIMARDEDPVDLDKTFERLEAHFDSMFRAGVGEGREQWQLSQSLSIKTWNVVSAVTGKSEDDDLIKTICPKWGDIITGNETDLTDDEAICLMNCLREKAIIHE